MKNNKFSIIMPTYNDSKTILEALDSIVKQKYNNWELIIVNDGSTDNTDFRINEFILINDLSAKIKYVTQSNQGQLQSIKNAIKYIRGDLVYILHSDDVFYNESVLTLANEYFNKKNCDAIITREIPTFNKDANNLTGCIKVKKYLKKKYIMPKLMINNGGNLYMDMAFVKKEVFIKNYYYNYLEWNRPFWCNIEENSLLNVESVDFKFFKYRVFEENYIQSDLGKLVQINGEIRTMVDLSKNYKIPFYNLQVLVYKVMKKLRLEKFFRPIFLRAQSSRKDVNKYLKTHITKRLKDTKCIKNDFIVALLKFYSKNTKQTIDLTTYDLKKYDIKGSDIRNYIVKNSNEVVNLLVLKMKEGFNQVVVKEGDKDYIENILHFLCISQYVQISVR